jgi:hypothetical protein
MVHKWCLDSGCFYLLWIKWRHSEGYRVEYPLVVLGNRCLADGIGYAHLVGRDVNNLIGETIDADEMRTQLTCILVGEIHNLSEVAVLQQVLLVLWSVCSAVKPCWELASFCKVVRS